MAFRATRLLRMRIDGSHQGNQMFGPPVCKTAYLDGSGPTFSAKKYVQPAPLRKLRPRSMPRYPCVPRVNSIEKWAKYKEDYHLRFKFTGRRTLDIAFWGIAIPVGLYFLIKNEQVSHPPQALLATPPLCVDLCVCSSDC